MDARVFTTAPCSFSGATLDYAGEPAVALRCARCGGEWSAMIHSNRDGFYLFKFKCPETGERLLKDLRWTAEGPVSVHELTD